MYLKRGYWIAYNVDPDQMPCFVAFDTIDTFAQSCTPDYLEQIRILRGEYTFSGKTTL